MIWNRPLGACWALVFLLALLGSSQEPRAESPTRTVGRFTRYDIATHGDMLLTQLVGPSTRGDVDEWVKTLLGTLPGQVGDWVNPYFDARTMANVITEAFPVEGQPALAPVDRIVADCARTLGIDKPKVYVRNNPLTRIYALQAGGRDHLILTSGLLTLFEERPEELKFVIGRELGHLKCGHDALKRKSYAVISVVQGINVGLVPDRFQNVLPTLTLGRLFSWCREAEFSADRAGLLCCNEPRSAYDAIMRLQHGLRASSPWIDPEAKEFDPQAVIRQFRDWQYQPFVQFILYVKEQPLDHPYYQERLASLKSWVDAGAYRGLRDRAIGDLPDVMIEVTKIRAFELAREGATVDPYVIISDGVRQVLRTRHASSVRDAEWKGFRSNDPGVDQPRSFRDGQPLFFEVWDANYVSDSFLGGFVIFPDGRDQRPGDGGEREVEYTAKIQWDWREAQSVSRPGHSRVWVKFTQRATAGESGVAKEK